MQHDNCYLLGYIVRTHGIKGEVMFFMDVDDPFQYEEMDSVFVEIKGELIPYFIEHVNIQRQGKAIVRLEGISTIEAAEPLVGKSLYMPLDVLDELDEGQFYYHEIEGFTVVDATLGTLGTITTVYSFESQNLIGMNYQGSEVLIPIIDQFVLRADKMTKELHVSLPEGLLDVYLSEQTPDDGDED
jgi:16S rRNA processing protein RimM